MSQKQSQKKSYHSDENIRVKQPFKRVKSQNDNRLYTGDEDEDEEVSDFNPTDPPQIN